MPIGDGTEGSVQAAVAAGGEVLAVGRIDDGGAMWSSTDNGASWTIVERDGIPPTWSLDDIAGQGDVVVVSGMTTPQDHNDGQGSQLMISTDGGNRWRRAGEPPPPERGVSFALPLFAGGGHFFTLTSSFVEAWSQPELRYADIELCRQGSVAALSVSDDGDQW